MDKKRIKVTVIIILSILIISAGAVSGYIYWKKYGRQSENSEGDYANSKIVYLKEDRLRILDENYNIASEIRLVNKYTKFKIVNENFLFLSNEDGNIAVVDVTKINEPKVTDEQKKMEKSGHRHLFVFNNGYIGVLSDNGIYAEEKDSVKGIKGKEIVKAVKDSSMLFYKIDKKGKINDVNFEEIKPFAKSGKYISLKSLEHILYFNRENENKIENIIEKSNIKDNNFYEVRENKINIYDVSGGKYPKKIFETDIEKDSFAITENGDIVQITKSADGSSIFKQYEYNGEKKLLTVKSEISGVSSGEIEVLRIIDNKLFYESVDGMGVNTELNFVDFEDIDAGIQNISSIDYENVKYIAKRDVNKYMFAEGNSLFEIDLSKRKVESGKSSYEKIYKTKYVSGFVKSSKNEIYTVYNDNKKLYIEKNDFNKITDFLEIEGISANSVDIYLKQIIDTPSGEKISLWSNELSTAESETEYRDKISKINEAKKKVETEGIEVVKTGNPAISNVIYDRGKLYYVAMEKVETTVVPPDEIAESEEGNEEQQEEREETTTGSGTGVEDIASTDVTYLYIADERLKIIEKYEILTEESKEFLLKEGDNIYIVGNSGLFIFNINSKEIRTADIKLDKEKEQEYSLISTKNKLFVFENIKNWTGNGWESTGKLYEIGRVNGEKLNEYSFEGKKINQIRSYEDKIVVADGKEIKVYNEEIKPIDKIQLKEEINFMEISGCRAYAAGTYMALAEVNLETSEIMSEKYIPNLTDADCIKLLFSK